MSADVIETVVSGSALYQAVLDSGGWSHRPRISAKLAKMGDRTRAMETTALRVPAWRTSPSSQLRLPFDEPIKVYDFPVVVEGNARARDLPLVIGWASRYIADGCPEDGMVRWTYQEAADWLAYSSYGGRAMQRVKQAVRRIRSAVLEQVAVRIGPGEPVPVDRGYGFIDDYSINIGRGDGRQWVKLNQTFAALLRLGRVTFLDHPIIRELQIRDEVALRIWLYLETESGPSEASGWRYAVFPGPDDVMPSISQLAWLTGERRKAVARLRRALVALCAADPRYSVSVDRKAQMTARRVTGETHETGHLAPEQDARNGALETHETGHLRRTKRGTSTLTYTSVTSKTSKNDSFSSTEHSPIPSALKAKGWQRPAKQLAPIREIARHRKLGNDAQVATIIREHHPGREHADLFGWLNEYRKPSRPIEPIPGKDPPPFCNGCDGSASEDWFSHDDYDSSGMRISLCASCRDVAA